MIESSKEIEERKQLKKASGIISIIDITKRTGADLIKFKLAGDDYIEYSLFGSFPFNAGDEIEFEYIIKDGRYYNVKNILTSVNSHVTINGEDVELLKKQLAGYDKITIKTILMRCSVDLCIARNELKDKEVFACYERFMEVVA